MKKLFFFVIMMCIGTFAAQAQKVGEKIEIDHNGTWYKGKIEKMEGDKYWVSYDDWDESWNEFEMVKIAIKLIRIEMIGWL